MVASNDNENKLVQFPTSLPQDIMISMIAPVVLRPLLQSAITSDNTSLVESTSSRPFDMI